jgi:pimeloyl-ACP methyl ester carboxylesterase
MITPRLALALAATTLALPVHAAGPYQITGSVESRVGPLVRTELSVQAGAHPLDRFKAYRLALDHHSGHSARGAILFLPPLGVSFSFYEQRDESGAFGSSIAEYFALRGFDVYGVSPRFTGIPAGTCEAGVLDCSVMAGWNLASLADDTAFIRDEIDVRSPGAEVLVGGASLGSMAAIATVNAHPGDYEGVVVWEGMLAASDPQVIALNQGYCAALTAQLAGGSFFDGVGANVFQDVSRFARVAPGDLTPLPLFPPFLTNRQVMLAVFSQTSPGPITMPVPNYIQMAGDADRLLFASEPRVHENISRFNSAIPVVLVRDVSCSLAGVETSYVNNLGSFTGAVLAIGGGRGFGPFMDHQIALFGGSDKTFLLEPGFGHIDHFMTARHRDFVERPILDWARRVLGH